MHVDRYEPRMAADWDAFVRSSRNGTFLFERGYMDYHADRFRDHSLVVRHEDEWLAVLPAHAAGNRIASHEGLSYGGLVLAPRMKAPIFLRVFEALLLHLHQAGFTTLDYKTVPHIYHRQPSEDDRYALFRVGAELTRRDVLSVVSVVDRLPYQHRRERGLKKARAAGITIQPESNYLEFWSLLAATLDERFGAEPVHTLDEIRLLRDRFPSNIFLHTARSTTGELLAGVVTYRSERAIHAQYIAASPAGRESHALDLLFDELLHDVSHDCWYFDFGSSHEEAGRVINEGLIEQKEGFGARSVVHDRYRIDLTAVRPGMLTEVLR
jgi:hypothetical protein